jgi:hypothetical protein
LDESITGKELCKLIIIDYQNIIGARMGDHADNLDYFVDELLKIKPVHESIKKRLNYP